MKKEIMYNGQVFSSFQKLYNSLPSPGISYATFIKRINGGMQVDDALRDSPSKREKSIEIGDLKFNSYTELANHIGITLSAVSRRIDRGWTLEEILHGKAPKIKVNRKLKKKGIPVTVNGTTYENMHVAHKELKPKASIGTVNARVRYGWSLEEAFELVEHVDKRTLPQNRPRNFSRPRINVTAFGKNYTTLSEFAQEYKIPYHVASRLLQKGVPFEEMVNWQPIKSVEVNGVTYRSASAAWKQIGKVSSTTFNERHRERLPIEVCLGIEPTAD